jgi:2-(1,2-epoxy-1,2-dihydrophenyl)acetyl-CoA isomerase
MSTKYIQVADEAGVRRLCLDDVASLNSLSEALAIELLALFKAADEDGSVRAVLLTGKGKTFCSGGNLKEFMQVTGPLDAYIGRLMRDLYNPLALTIRNLTKPVIVAMNGAAIGAGVGLALSGDLVFAARSSYFMLPFVPALGVVPDMGSSWLMPRLLGYGKALGFALTGERLSADQAQAAGLIWKCLPEEELEATAKAAANKLAALPQQAVQRTKLAFARSHQQTFAEQLELEREMQMASFAGTEFLEGLRAFKERRAPDFNKA